MQAFTLKKFLGLFTLFMAIAFVVPEADARKLGGGSRSIGKTHRTAPAQPAQQPSTPQQSPDAKPGTAGAAGAAAAGSRRGMMGGLLGGLLMGGLIASLFGGAFEGIQFMDILIIGGIAYLIYRFMKGRAASQTAQSRPSAQGSTWQQAPPVQPQRREQVGMPSSAPESVTPGSAGDDVPFTLPNDFNMPQFLEGARSHYRTVQKAWDENDQATLAEYLAPEILSIICAERDSLASAPITQVMFVDAELVRAQTSERLAQVSVKFVGRYRDVGEGDEKEITDIWHLERDLTQANAPWLIVGIES